VNLLKEQKRNWVRFKKIDIETDMKLVDREKEKRKEERRLLFVKLLFLGLIFALAFAFSIIFINIY
jgi:hypothetical protein